MSEVKKERHKQVTDIYRKTNPEIYRQAALKYYYSNKEKVALRHKEWRLLNKEYIIEQQRLKKRERKLEAIAYLGNKCMKCAGEFHPSVYEFHHISPEDKDRDPSKMLSLSKKRLFSELDKCQLLCANCHRLTHHGENY